MTTMAIMAMSKVMVSSVDTENTFIIYTWREVWICRLLFVILFVFLVCTVTDFSGEEKASGVKFCTVVYRRSGQGISNFGELCSPRSPKSDESATHLKAKFRVVTVSREYHYRAACGRRIGVWIYGRPRRRTYSFNITL